MQVLFLRDLKQLSLCRNVEKEEEVVLPNGIRYTSCSVILTSRISSFCKPEGHELIASSYLQTYQVL